MAKNDIAIKITALLDQGIENWEEPHVVYFLVELRKFLDHLRDAAQQDLPHLRFYCDWVVHISKDRIDPITLNVLREIEESVLKQIMLPMLYLKSSAVDFAYFRSLKAEVSKLLKSAGIDGSPLDSESVWVRLVGMLVKVLEDQPLNVSEKHGLNIKSLIFLPSAPQAVILRIDFNQPVVDDKGTKYPYYVLKNAY